MCNAKLFQKNYHVFNNNLFRNKFVFFGHLSIIVGTPLFTFVLNKPIGHHIQSNYLQIHNNISVSSSFLLEL